MASSTTQPNQNPAEQTQQSGKGKRKMLIYLAILVLAVVVIGLILLLTPTSIIQPSARNLPQSNAAPIYMSISDAQLLLGSSIVNYTANYTTTSIYNKTSPYNITLLEGIEPQLVGNVTNGWTTLAFGSNSNNASILYNVLQTYNASSMAAHFAQSLSSSFPTLPSIGTGATNGLNYTYETYRNSTGSYQALIGWKNGYVAVFQLEANNPTSNQSQIAKIVSSEIP